MTGIRVRGTADPAEIAAVLTILRRSSAPPPPGGIAEWRLRRRAANGGLPRNFAPGDRATVDGFGRGRR